MTTDDVRCMAYDAMVSSVSFPIKNDTDGGSAGRIICGKWVNSGGIIGFINGEWVKIPEETSFPEIWAVGNTIHQFYMEITGFQKVTRPVYHYNYTEYITEEELIEKKSERILEYNSADTAKKVVALYFELKSRSENIRARAKMGGIRDLLCSRSGLLGKEKLPCPSCFGAPLLTTHSLASRNIVLGGPLTFFGGCLIAIGAAACESGSSCQIGFICSGTIMAAASLSALLYGITKCITVNREINGKIKLVDSERAKRSLPNAVEIPLETRDGAAVPVEMKPIAETPKSPSPAIPQPLPMETRSPETAGAAIAPFTKELRARCPRLLKLSPEREATVIHHVRDALIEGDFSKMMAGEGFERLNPIGAAYVKTLMTTMSVDELERMKSNAMQGDESGAAVPVEMRPIAETPKSPSPAIPQPLMEREPDQPNP